MTTTKAPGRLQLGSPRAWSVVLGSLALLSFAAMIPLCLPSGQLPNAVIAAVIGVPCAAVGFSSPPPWRWPALLPPIRSALTAPARVLLLSLAFIARQALRWRRSTGERRQQLKWLASGAAVTIVCLVLGGPRVLFRFVQAGPGRVGLASGHDSTRR